MFIGIFLFSVELVFPFRARPKLALLLFLVVYKPLWPALNPHPVLMDCTICVPSAGGDGGDTHSLNSLRVVSSALTQQRALFQYSNSSRNGPLLTKINNVNNNTCYYCVITPFLIVSGCAERFLSIYSNSADRASIHTISYIGWSLLLR